MAIEIIFWTSVLLIFYTYFLYPGALVCLVALKEGKQTLAEALRMFRVHAPEAKRKAGRLPSVSMIIAAYNEEKVIKEKIQNCLDIEYPGELEFLVGSDGSSDRTNEILARNASGPFRTFPFKQRRGKPSVLNDLAAKAKGEVLVFSDANTMYEADAVERLVRKLEAPSVGCVCGRLVITESRSSSNQDSLYWRYETVLKYLESRLGVVLGANGGIYAIRRELFRPIAPNTIVDDFVIGMRVNELGYRTIYDHEAIATEEAAEDVHAEHVRRIRIGAGNFQSIFMLRRLVNPFRGLIAYAFWSHKIIRWFVPFFMISAFVSGAYLAYSMDGGLYKVLFAAQALFYALSFAVKGGSGNSPVSKLVRLSNYFVNMNLALLKGFVRFVTNTQKVAWKRTNRT